MENMNIIREIKDNAKEVFPMNPMNTTPKTRIYSSISLACRPISAKSLYKRPFIHIPVLSG